MAKNTEVKDNMNIFFRAVVVFLVITAAAIGIFFYHVEGVIRNNVRESVSEKMKVQSFHFRSMLDTQYRYLESAADYVEKQEDMNSRNSIEVLRSLRTGVGMKRAAFIDSRGRVSYDNGEKGSVLSRTYFRELMEGKRILSTSVVKEEGKESRMIIGVPIRRDGRVAGALCASYELVLFGEMMDSNSYDGQGETLLIDGQGRVIANDRGDIDREALETPFFEWLTESKTLVNHTVEEVRADFAEGRRSRMEVRENDVDRWYVEYTPAGYNDWMLCYFITADKAEAKYSQLKKYEITLAVVLIFSVIFLFSLFYFRNSRNMESVSLLAKTDGLSGVLNKRGTEEGILAWLASPECQDVQAFLILDVDNFKQINDIYGHHAGDLMIRQVGNCLRTFFREKDIIGRIGGDEFAVLMKNVPAEQTAFDRAQQLLVKFRSLKLPQYGIDGVTCSMGMAFFPGDATNYTELYKKADIALYRTKQNGKNGLTVFDK